jgi:hypothetical protein
VPWTTAACRVPHGLCREDLQGVRESPRHTYLYHTHHWRRAASYVALTRQRESAQVFVARETGDASELARQMARGEMKAASVAWTTREEICEASGTPEACARRMTRNAAPGYVARNGRDSLGARVRNGLARIATRPTLGLASCLRPRARGLRRSESMRA